MPFARRFPEKILYYCLSQFVADYGAKQAVLLHSQYFEGSSAGILYIQKRFVSTLIPVYMALP